MSHNVIGGMIGIDVVIGKSDTPNAIGVIRMPQRSLSFMFLFVALAAIAMTTNAQDDDESVSTSRLQIQIPLSLKKDGGYEHKEALFGMPPYGGSIEQNVYFADADLCDPTFDYSRGGFPTRETDESGAMEAFKTPFILMVDRGSCTFVKKARNAQKAGAAAMIIADTTCLCIAGDSCVSVGEAFCETKEPIMADDGSGSDVTIPSFLMYKQDADPIKEVLKKKSDCENDHVLGVTPPGFARRIYYVDNAIGQNKHSPTKRVPTHRLGIG